ncbi:MAG TPA: replication initiator protein A [Azospirillum sp.]|nr:replication initiator protein A [Azospirillum sp.]HYD64764.1 replication initiator protein A [Azospirillum sp.]
MVCKWSVPFTAIPDAVAPRDQRDLMERPFFSLAKGRRVVPIHYRTTGVEVIVEALPACGMATIWDADVLIWAASQIVEALDHGLTPSRLIRFTPYQLLKATGRDTTQRHYQLLRGALHRLQATVVRTTIRHGEGWRQRAFSWITEWGDRVDARGRSHGMELVLPDWFYRGVLDRTLVLSIDPAYFRLTGGIERWLYRIARKHAGHQPAGWAFDLRHLHAKSGSLARFSDFALDLRRIARRQPLPGYRLAVQRPDGGAEVLRVAPLPGIARGGAPAITAVDKAVRDAMDNMTSAVTPVDTSGASGIDTSGAADSIHRAHEPDTSPWPETPIRPRNFSNKESNKETCCWPRSAPALRGGRRS